MSVIEGKLHWLSKMLEFVPSDLNLVIIGSNLTEQEIEWIRSCTKFPLCTFRTFVEYDSLWEYFFAVTTDDFGWIDIDCFVLEPKVFRELADIEPNVAINSCWSDTHDDTDLPLLRTGFFFFNHAVLCRLREAKAPVSPRQSDLTGSIINRRRRFTLGNSMIYYRMWSEEDRHLLVELFTAHANGRPKVRVLDTLRFYQLVAHYHGYRSYRVRDLGCSIGDGRPIYSDELIHVGQMSTYARWVTRFRRPNEKAIRRLAFEYSLLSASVEHLPDVYRLQEREKRNSSISLALTHTRAKEVSKTFCVATG